MNLGDLIYDVHTNETLLSNNVFSDTKNESLNANITEELGSTPYHPITTFIEQYTIPVICLLGVIGNTLASIVFLQKPLRKSSCSIFLASRGFSDNGFLSTLLIIWISQTFHLQLGAISGSCKIIIFLSYLCGFVSVWLVVFVTLENYIRICKPFVVKRYCTTNNAKIAVASLCIISICLYNFPFWAMSSDNCEPFPRYHDAVQVLIYTDSVITLVFPLLCIIFLIAAIVCGLIKSYSMNRASRVSRSNNPLAKVTKMLFAVTLTFFCFNLPSHVYRLIIMISSFVQTVGGQKYYSLQEEAIQQTTLLMSYLSFSTNIIVYTIFGSKFRTVLLQMLRLQSIVCIPSSKREQQTTVDTAIRHKRSNSAETAAIRSLTVLLKDKEFFSELEPLHRANTQ